MGLRQRQKLHRTPAPSASDHESFFKIYFSYFLFLLSSAACFSIWPPFCVWASVTLPDSLPVLFSIKQPNAAELDPPLCAANKTSARRLVLRVWADPRKAEGKERENSSCCVYLCMMSSLKDDSDERRAFTCIGHSITINHSAMRRRPI